MTDSDNESRKQQGLSKEAWTAISAVAVALIGGIVTVVTTLVNKQPSPSPSSTTPSSDTVGLPTTSSPSTSIPVQPEVANIPLGKWSGVAKEPSGASFPINVEINQACNLNQKCGYISVPEIPCYGEISFVSMKSNYYEFDVSNFDTKSNPNICKPGAGELFQLLPNNRLAYKTTYSNAEGILERVE
jgi:hypothetical protein